MNLDPALTELDVDRLRKRRSVKWALFEPDVLPAWVAEMDYPLAPAVKRALAEAIELDDTGYAHPLVPGGLRDAFAAFAERRLDWRVDPEQVVPLVDAVAGLTELLRALLRPGDGVIITPPVYHPFFSLVPEAGCELVEVPLDAGRDLDLDGIERAFAAGARAIVLCNPHNPTGRVVSRSGLEALAALAAEHEAWVLADEIHAPLLLPGATHVPFAAVSDAAAARGVVVTSASKAFNVPGLKCALAVTAGEPARSAVAELPVSATHCGHLGAIASVAAFEHGDEWLDAVLSVLDANRVLIADLLAERLPEVGYEPPAAGYLAWLDLSELGLGDDPALALLERGRVALSSGPQFGRGGEGRARLNFGTSPALVTEAVARIARAVER